MTAPDMADPVLDLVNCEQLLRHQVNPEFRIKYQKSLLLLQTQTWSHKKWSLETLADIILHSASSSADAAWVRSFKNRCLELFTAQNSPTTVLPEVINTENHWCFSAAWPPSMCVYLCVFVYARISGIIWVRTFYKAQENSIKLNNRVY